MNIFNSQFVQIALPIIVTLFIAAWMNGRAFDTINRSFDSMSKRIDDLSTGINKRLDDLAARLLRIEIRLERIEEKRTTTASGSQCWKNAHRHWRDGHERSLHPHPGAGNIPPAESIGGSACRWRQRSRKIDVAPGYEGGICVSHQDTDSLAAV